MKPDPVDRVKAELVAFDFSGYRLEQLDADVRSILDVRAAISRIAGVAFGAAAAVGVVSLAVFALRFSSWPIGLAIGLICFLVALPTGATLGGWLVARRRLSLITAATTRVVDVIGEIHHDLNQVRAGAASASVRAVGQGIVEEAILPIGLGAATKVAEGLLGPLGFLVDRIAARPRKLVERAAVAVVSTLPDRQIGSVVSQGAFDAIDRAGMQQLGPGELARTTAALRADYDRIRTNVDAIVRKVSRASLGVGMLITMVAVLPLVLVVGASVALS